MWTLDNFYQSKEWKNLRKIVLLENQLRNNGKLICDYSGEEITGSPIVHHTIELTNDNVNDVNVSLNQDLLMVVSMASHNKIHERYKKNWKHEERKVFIVYGSPRAGKNTFVSKTARDYDLIVDIDAIWDCICLGGQSSKPDRLKQNVFALRDELLEQVRLRKGKWSTAYIITTLPRKLERERLAKSLNAELLFIEADVNVCLKRCKTDQEREWVLRWFEDFQP